MLNIFFVGSGDDFELPYHNSDSTITQGVHSKATILMADDDDEEEGFDEIMIAGRQGLLKELPMTATSMALKGHSSVFTEKANLLGTPLASQTPNARNEDFPLFCQLIGLYPTTNWSSLLLTSNDLDHKRFHQLSKWLMVSSLEQLKDGPTNQSKYQETTWVSEEAAAAGTLRSPDAVNAGARAGATPAGATPATSQRQVPASAQRRVPEVEVLAQEPPPKTAADEDKQEEEEQEEAAAPAPKGTKRGRTTKASKK